MTGGTLVRVIEFLAEGNRPIRILVFGGIVLAWLIMKILNKLLGIDTDFDDGFEFSAVLLVVVSMLGGFGISFSFYNLLERVRKDRERRLSR